MLPYQKTKKHEATLRRAHAYTIVEASLELRRTVLAIASENRVPLVELRGRDAWRVRTSAYSQLAALEVDRLSLLTIVLRKDVTVVAADGLDVFVAVCGDALLDWDADLFDVVSRRLRAMGIFDSEYSRSSRLQLVAWCCSSRHSRRGQDSMRTAERW